MKSISYKLALVAGIVVFALSFCKKDDSSSSSKEKGLPYYLLLTDTVFEVYDTQITLKGQPTESDEQCEWTIVKDSSSTGKLIDTQKPTTTFTGKLFNTYILKYTMTKGNETKSQLVTVKFVVPDVLKSTTLESFNTTDTVDTVITLNAVALGTSLSGKWAIITNDPYKSGVIDDKTKADAKFTGRMGYSYKLYWEVTDGTVTKGDTLILKLNSYTDPRDKEKYKVTRIGTQLWMAQNLRYKNAQSVYLDADSYNSSDFTASVFGNLYTFKEAMEAAPTGWRVAKYDDWNTLSNYVSSQVTSAEMITALKGSYGWTESVDDFTGASVSTNGTDLYGFNLLASGFKMPSWNSSSGLYGNTMYGFGKITLFWTPDIETTDSRCSKVIGIYYTTASPITGNTYLRNYLLGAMGTMWTVDYYAWYPEATDIGYCYSVRCIKN
jgi:uncharacterized protein (TIGR02145 family)